MIRSEISLRLGNSPGALAGVCRLLSDERVNILAMTLEADFFYRQSDRDGIYSPAGALLRLRRVSRAQHVGEQVSVQPEWRIDSHLSLTANYTHFLAGRFLRETGPGKDIDYAAARLQYRF